jgi:predicted nuclease with TOPRIM domain
MPDPTSHRSSRFTQAARSERKRLDRKRSKLSKKREALQIKIDDLDAELEAVEQEIVVLDNLAGGPARSTTLELASASEDGDVLQGSAIRATAIPLLMREQGTAPIHYRDWLQLLEREGYKVAGKRIDAVFLNQVARSPVVRATTKAGYYQLDPNAPEQLRERLRGQQAELGGLLTDVPADPAGFERQREEQRELKKAAAKTERELREALEAIETFEAINSTPAVAEAA